MKKLRCALAIIFFVVQVQCFERTITLRNISIPVSILMGAGLVRDGIVKKREQAGKATRFFVALEECEQQTEKQQSMVFYECMRRAYVGERELREHAVAAKKFTLETGFKPDHTRMMLKKIEEIDQKARKRQ